MIIRLTGRSRRPDGPDPGAQRQADEAVRSLRSWAVDFARFGMDDAAQAWTRRADRLAGQVTLNPEQLRERIGQAVVLELREQAAALASLGVESDAGGDLVPAVGLELAAQALTGRADQLAARGSAVTVIDFPPQPATAPVGCPAEVAAAYSRQADELAAMVEDLLAAERAAGGRPQTLAVLGAVARALGEQCGELDELAYRLHRQNTCDGSGGGSR